MPGTLYVVSTPIGNLGDVTHRAIETLGSVSTIACEDTRTTGKLLKRWGIHTKTLSFHEHNEARRGPELLERLRRGDDIALVSDAGTPLISDPGFRLVRAAQDEGIAVRAVPGASALLAALVVSGLPTSSFTFVGFVPPRGAARNEAIDEVARAARTIVLFEAPTRIARLLRELSEREPLRRGCVCREMTKLHEEHRHGSVAELAEWAATKTFKGELTVVLGPSPAKPAVVSVDELAPAFQKLRDEGLSAREASKRLAREHGLPTRTIYNHFNR